MYVKVSWIGRSAFCAFSALAATIALALTGCSSNGEADARPFFCVAFSANGKSLAAGRGTFQSRGRGAGSGDVLIWSTETWAEPKVLQNDLTGPVKGVAFSGDNEQVISASNAFRPVTGSGNPYDGIRIYSWKVETGTPTELRPNPVLSKNASIDRVSYAPKCGILAFCISGPVIIDLGTQKQTPELEGHEGRGSNCLAFSPDEKTIASCVWQSAREKEPRRPLRIFAVETGKLVAASDTDGKHPYSVAFSPNGAQLAAGCNTGELLFLTGNLDRIEATLQIGTLSAADKKGPSDVQRLNGWVPELDAKVLAVAYSPNGELVAAATRDAVHLVDAKEKKVKQVLGEKLAHVRAIAFSPDGKLLAAAYGTHEEDGRNEKPAGGVLVWEVSTGKLIKDLK